MAQGFSGALYFHNDMLPLIFACQESSFMKCPECGSQQIVRNGVLEDLAASNDRDTSLFGDPDVIKAANTSEVPQKW